MIILHTFTNIHHSAYLNKFCFLFNCVSEFVCYVFYHFAILVVTFRRPPKNNNNAQNEDTTKHNLIDKSTNDDDIDEPNVSNESRANSGSRKRKKPGEGLYLQKNLKL